MSAKASRSTTPEGFCASWSKMGAEASGFRSKTSMSFGGSGFKPRTSMGSGARAKKSSSTKKVDKKIWTRNENETRIDCIIIHLEECDNDPKLIKDAIHHVQLRTCYDLEELNAKPVRISLEENPDIPFLTCCFYQIGQCYQKVYAGVHLDKNVDITKKAFLHVCPLCLRQEYLLGQIILSFYHTQSKVKIHKYNKIGY